MMLTPEQIESFQRAPRAARLCAQAVYTHTPRVFYSLLQKRGPRRSAQRGARYGLGAPRIARGRGELGGGLLAFSSWTSRFIGFRFSMFRMGT